MKGNDTRDPIELVESSVDTAGAIIKLLAEHDLADQAVEHLKSNGVREMDISAGSAKHLKGFVREEFQARAKAEKGRTLTKR